MERDFARMAALGVNTIQGWNAELFDEGLMNAAAANGLGVILPFELDPKADYSDYATRTRLMGRIEEWVRRFRNHPALHMWGLGNEVLHKMENHQIKRLPVIENRRLVGIISEADLARNVDEHRLAEFAEKVYARA